MSISSLSSNSAMQQMMPQMQQRPTASDFTAEIMDTSDLDSDSLLSIEEIGLSQEDFSSYDSDQDGFLSAEELEETLSSKLDSVKNNELTLESFASLLSDMGVDVPTPPVGQQGPNASQIASDVFSTQDTDSNGLMTIDELGIDEDLFASWDTDEDGAITQEELEEGLTTLFSSVESGETSKSEAGAVLSTLGVQAQGGTPPPPPSGGGTEEEEYDAADANEDGIVTDAEQAAYDGATQNEMQDYALQLVSSLLDALKEESSTDSDSMDLTKFKSVMSMINNETQEENTANKLNTYVSNLDLGLKTA